MPKYQHNNKINNNQDTVSPLEPSDPNIVAPEKCNIAETHDKDFKISIMNMFKDLKEKKKK